MRINGQPVPQEGAFTPTFTFATPGNLSNAYTTQTGLWKRYGNRVDIYARLNVTPTHTTASGDGQIGGLPYTVGAMSGSMNVRMIGTQTWPGTTGTMVQALPIAGQNYMVLYASKSAGGESSFTHAVITSAAAFNVAITGFYFI